MTTALVCDPRACLHTSSITDKHFFRAERSPRVFQSRSCLRRPQYREGFEILDPRQLRQRPGHCRSNHRLLRSRVGDCAMTLAALELECSRGSELIWNYTPGPNDLELLAENEPLHWTACSLQRRHARKQRGGKTTRDQAQHQTSRVEVGWDPCLDRVEETKLNTRHPVLRLVGHLS